MNAKHALEKFRTEQISAYRKNATELVAAGAPEELVMLNYLPEDLLNCFGNAELLAVREAAVRTRRNYVRGVRIHGQPDHYQLERPNYDSGCPSPPTRCDDSDPHR